MGKVAISIKVSGKEGQDIASIGESIKNIEGVKEVNTEEVGFGIKVLKVLVLVDDAGGEGAKMEEKIQDVDGVDSIEVLETTLI